MHIYVHLPFCLSHCIYCDFYVELKGTEDRRKAYLAALQQEITHYLSGQENPPLQTLYLGGGTPGLFSAPEIAQLLLHLQRFVTFAADIEITLEANPEGMASPPEAYGEAGINRLSTGVQSLQPNELKRLSRVHSRDQVFRFLESARTAGFENISLDLMYGIPEQTVESWAKTLSETAKLDVPHLSMYGLKVEEGTRLADLVASGRMSTPPDETTVDMYFQALEFLEAQGYRRYEISNLAKLGFESRHNLCYWENREFWGFGVSAHGYIDSLRYENPRDLAAYLAEPAHRTEAHLCDNTEKLENALIFGLRLRDGVHLPTLNALHQIDILAHYGPRIARFLDAGLLQVADEHLQLSEEAIPVSNEILACFLED